MSAPDLYGHEDFMREYECIVDREFELNGRVASWAPSQSDSGPRIWDEEDESIDLPGNNPDSGIAPTSALALTPDDKYLAVSVNTIVRLYDVETLELCVELAPHQRNVDGLHFRPHTPIALEEDARYTLISQTRGLEMDSTIHKSIFDADGHLVGQDPAQTSPLANGSLPSLASSIWSADGNRMIYIAHPEPTRHATTPQPASELPQVVILDLLTDREVCRLLGHQDAIMWASWSPDSTTIATASWDHTYGLWDAQSGIRKHTIGPTPGQNWCGAFLGDGIHVLLSGTAVGTTTPEKVGIYNIETGAIVVGLQPSEGIQLDRRLRDFAVRPSGELVVLSNGRSLLAWEPFEPERHVQVLLALHPSQDLTVSGFGGLQNLKFVDRGRKLVAQCEDQTIFAWDPEKQWKWRFQRPRGRAVDDGYGTDVLYVRRQESEWLLSMGENRVRLWRL